jgi:hypothetical protein
LIAAAALPFAAAAQITIAVGADEQRAANDEVTFDAAVTRAWGRAGAALNDAFAHIEPGHPGCLIVDCGPFLTLPGASGTARADATKMNVGVRAYAASSPHVTQGFGDASVRDTLVTAPGPGMLTFDIHLDLSLSASADAEARYSFSIALGSGDSRRVEFAFLAWEESAVRSAEVLLDNGNTSIVLPAIPSSYDYILNVPTFGAGSIAIEVNASAVAESGSAEFSSVSAFDSAWLGIAGSYTSLNGYAYPGFAAAIPEPTHVALLLAGLGVVTLRCRWGRRGLRLPAAGSA